MELAAPLARLVSELEEALSTGVVDEASLAVAVQRCARGDMPERADHAALAWRLAWWLFARAPQLDGRYLALAPMHTSLLAEGQGSWRNLVVELGRLEALQAAPHGAGDELWTVADVAQWVRSELRLDRADQRLEDMAEDAEARVLASARAGAWDAVPLQGSDQAAVRHELSLLPREDSVEVVRLWMAAGVEAQRRRFDRALVFSDEACARAPRLFENYVRSASHRFGMDDHAGASADLDRALALYADCTAARAMRAELRAVQGDMPGSLTDWQVAVRGAPGHPGYRLGLGSTLLAMGDHEGALRHLNVAVQASPDDPALRYTRADLHVRRQDLDGALADYAVVIAMKDEPLVRINRGTVHMLRQEVELAFRDFDAALRMRPNADTAWAKRGHARLSMADAGAAWLDFLTALALAPVEWPHREQVESLVHLAASKFEEGRDGRPGPEDVDARIEELMTIADRAQVSRFADLLDAHLPYEDVGFHVSRGALLAAAARWRDAETAYRAALAVDATHAAARLGLARAQLEQGDATASVATGEAALKRMHALDADQTFALHLTRARAYGALQQLSPALAAFDEALALQPERADVWFYKAVHLDLDGQREASVLAYDRSIGLDGTFAPAWFNRACEKSLLGDLDGALADLERAIVLDPATAALAIEDAYLEPLRGQPRFSEVIALGG